MENCIFCKIVAGDIPAEKVFEDTYTVAFLDVRPANKGHLLVIPKEHHANIYEISEQAWADVMKTVKVVSPALKKATEADGVNIVMNNEPAAGQVVMHAHVHIVPRFKNKGNHYGWSGHETYAAGEATSTAEKIRSEI